MLTLLEIIIASISGNYNCQHFWKVGLTTSLENIIANISENIIPEFRLLTILEIIFVTISEIIFSGFREFIIDNTIENIVAIS